MPQEICDLFTEGQRAALNIIANVVREYGECDWPIDKVAAIAGVCRRTVQYAIHTARNAGLLTVQQRPRRGRKNLTNIIRISNGRWKSWIRNSRSSFRLAIGCKFPHPTGEYILHIGKSDSCYSEEKATWPVKQRCEHGIEPDH